ncbi:MAG: sigma-70 family RNA polymerase sigma factor [Anaerolineae bacterium]|nr:sigma-70 family RNA polymerase sigma factor [Anaerolineae bacterium]
MKTEPEDDAHLVRAASRDVAAFGTLYRRYVTPIYRYLYSRVGNATDAQDLTAQVFLEALQGLAHYRERGTFRAWLFTIAHHKAADHHRRKRPDVPLDEARDATVGVEGPLARLVREEALERLAGLVQQLDDDKQEMIRLRFAGGLTYREIGHVVGRREGAVKMAVHRLLRQLEAEWEEDDD